MVGDGDVSRFLRTPELTIKSYPSNTTERVFSRPLEKPMTSIASKHKVAALRDFEHAVRVAVTMIEHGVKMLRW